MVSSVTGDRATVISFWWKCMTKTIMADIFWSSSDLLESTPVQRLCRFACISRILLLFALVPSVCKVLKERQREIERDQRLELAGKYKENWTVVTVPFDLRLWCLCVLWSYWIFWDLFGSCRARFGDASLWRQEKQARARRRPRCFRENCTWPGQVRTSCWDTLREMRFVNCKQVKEQMKEQTNN